MSAAEINASPSEAQIALRYFALGLLLALLVAILAASVRLGSDFVQDEDALAERIHPLADLEIAPPAGHAIRGKRTGAAVVQEYCQSCHRKGQGGAPQIGDRKAWAPRLGKGLEALVQSAKSGKSGMPPRGGSDADDMELARAIVFMIWPRMRL